MLHLLVGRSWTAYYHAQNWVRSDDPNGGQSKGTALYQEVCERDLEGIICKRKDSVYSSLARWLKVKNPNYSQAEGRREMFEKFRG